MIQEIRNLAKKYPNDQELGEKIRQYLEENITCCSYDENIGVYTDLVGNKYQQCKVCSKILDKIL